jgi:hypothetical protein
MSIHSRMLLLLNEPPPHHHDEPSSSRGRDCRLFLFLAVVAASSIVSMSLMLAIYLQFSSLQFQFRPLLGMNVNEVAAVMIRIDRLLDRVCAYGLCEPSP